MKNLVLFSFIAALTFFLGNLLAQEVKKLTFEEVIKLSEEQSPNALIAKHRFRSSYWEYRSYQAQFLPSLTLSGTTPDFSNGLTKVYDSGTDQYIYLYKKYNQYFIGNIVSFAEYWFDRYSNCIEFGPYPL
jgi:outer membrane protein TolC